ncbi:MAG: hypothetical protein ACLR17_03405 [Enterobacteriaceae bacterium]
MLGQTQQFSAGTRSPRLPHSIPAHHCRSSSGWLYAFDPHRNLRNQPHPACPVAIIPTRRGSFPSIPPVHPQYGNGVAMLRQRPYQWCRITSWQYDDARGSVFHQQQRGAMAVPASARWRSAICGIPYHMGGISGWSPAALPAAFMPIQRAAPHAAKNSSRMVYHDGKESAMT